MSGQRVTMRRVAEVAGVSTASVSRALSGSRPVKPEVAAAVGRACEELGYRTNHVARALRRRSTQSVGMVVPNIGNPFFPHVVQGVERHLQVDQQALLLSDSQELIDVEAQRVSWLLERQVDGLLVIPVDEASETALADAAAQVPLVQIDRVVAGVPADYVGVDNAAGTRLILDHLERRGCRRVAYLGADGTTSTAVERHLAFRYGAPRLDPDNAGRVLLGDFSLEWGLQAGAELARRPPLPDAVVCANDLIAIGAIRALKSAGLDVPADILVTGFDDIEFAVVTDPRLTTVRQPIDRICQLAVARLASHLNGTDEPPQRILLSPTLIERDSTARKPAPSQ